MFSISQGRVGGGGKAGYGRVIILSRKVWVVVRFLRILALLHYPQLHFSTLSYVTHLLFHMQNHGMKML